MHSVGRALASLGAAALVVAAAVLPAPPAGAAGDVDATIGVATPQIEAGDDFEVSLLLDNASSEPVSASSAQLEITYGTVDTRFALSSWLNDENVLGTRPIADVEIPVVGAGSTYSSTFPVEADDLGLGDGAQTGAYGLRLTVDGATASTLIVVGSPGGDPSITLSTAAPISTPVTEEGLLLDEQLTALTSSVGSLNRQLRTVADLPISVGLDPMVETSVEFEGDAAPESAVEWVDQANDLPNAYSLPYAMSDRTAQLAAGLQPLQPLGVPDSEALTGEDTYFPPQLPHDDVTDLTGRSVDTELLQAVADTGIPLLSTSQIDEEEQYPTPDAGVMIGDQQALAADSELLALLDAASSGYSEAERNAGSAEVLALIATIAREAPNTPRNLAAIVDVSGVGAEHLLTTLDDSDWVTLAPLSSALEAPARDASLHDLESTELETALAEGVTAAHDADAEMSRFSLIATQPRELTVPFRLKVLAAMHVDAATTPASVTSSTTMLGSELESLQGGVQVLQGSDIHIVGSNVQLPIELVNDLEVGADVVVKLRTTSTIVVVSEGSTEVTIGAESSQRVLMPVEVVGSGVTTAIVTLETAGGHQISQPVTINVQAQPSVETVIVWIGASAVVLLIGFGLWRSLRKRAQGKALGDLDGARVPGPTHKESSAQ
ncbi:MAG: DUF6049 family protein [Agrococcus casei]|uniref:DUF6049 family protein n=1 Tax=Agrococcus casei TaxID=343512 RepID=UPI003F943309